MSNDQHIFAIAPLEMARDHRLTAAQYRILLALLSFRNREGNLVWPSRERLAELTGYTVNTISKYTRQLEGIGWLEKDGKGGRSMAVRYRITVPDLDLDEGETVTEQVTVSRLSHPVDNRGTYQETLSNPETVSNQETVSNPDTKTLSNPDRGKEQTREQTNSCAANARAREDDAAVEHGDVKHPSSVKFPNDMIATLAELGFRHEQVHTPKVIAMLRRWNARGVKPDDIRQLVITLRARAPNREFGPAYLDAPMNDYIEALSNEQTETGSTTRTTGHRRRTKAEMFWDNIRPGLEVPWDAPDP